MIKLPNEVNSSNEPKEDDKFKQVIEQMQLDFFLAESNFDFQFSAENTWAFMELAIRNAIIKYMEEWFKDDKFDTDADFILSYCSGELQHHIDNLIGDFMDAWRK